MTAFCAALGLLLLVSCGGGDMKTPVAPSVPPTTTYTVSGIVRDDAGAPLEGASVTGGVVYSKTGPRFTTKTDAAGQYLGNLPKGAHQLLVSKPGFEAFYLRELVVSGDTVVDVTLHPGVYVVGKVRELGVDLLNDVKIEVVSGPNAGRSTLTGYPVRGQYYLDHLSPGEFRMRASKDNYDPVERAVNATVSTTLDFTLKWAYGTCLRSVVPVFFDAYPSAGGSETVSVDANAGRTWTAAADERWIELASPAAQTGPGQITFRVLSHPLGAIEPRKGAVMIRCNSSEGQNVWIVQNPDCQIHLERAADSPDIFSAAGGVGHLLVHTGTPSCHWHASSQTDWIFVAGIIDWSGDRDVRFGVRENTTGIGRTGSIVVGETVWQVKQR